MKDVIIVSWVQMSRTLWWLILGKQKQKTFETFQLSFFITFEETLFLFHHHYSSLSLDIYALRSWYNVVMSGKYTEDKAEATPSRFRQLILSLTNYVLVMFYLILILYGYRFSELKNWQIAREAFFVLCFSVVNDIANGLEVIKCEYIIFREGDQDFFFYITRG